MESIFKLIFIVGLASFLLYVLIGALKSLFAMSWPKANGEVLYAGILEESDCEGSTFIPVIEFKYTVRGKVYKSNNFAFGFLASGFRFLSKSIFKKYRNRPYVKVSYNPKKPSQGVLLTGIRFFHIFDMGLIIGLFYVFGPKLGL